MDERKLKHWVIDYVGEHVGTKFKPVEGWISETVNNLNANGRRIRSTRRPS